jgi:hypothetical protein
MQQQSVAQGALFYDDLNAALQAVVAALGGTKKVAGMLKPEQTPATAQTWLNGCLNGGERAHLTPEQLLWLMRAGAGVGCHAAMQFFAAEAGYCAPEMMRPEDDLSQAMAVLREQQAATQRQLETVNRAMSRMQALRSVA